ncbi:hypothetical protein [Umezawaea sp. Da 62-37]|uniref:hypothetical protein n=1 Tax=Umezawaea sp. Da 62-37 TaxID=3075927 RepID=UPI0028F73BB3|nr:hypothetical protein [Umezawaea sp. Da 62-37]WNV89952.1 hypothetical protein RM788_17125 [Umezawaea sp. Da 62-37]
MRRRLLAAIPLALLVACGSTPPPPAPTTSQVKGELAVLAERIAQRRAELKTARFHTDGFASDGGATEVRNTADGAISQTADGVLGAFTMGVDTGGAARKIDLVVLKDALYAHLDGAAMPAGKKWAQYTEANAGEISGLLRGFGPSSMAGAELDYLEPTAALVLRKASEQLDGTPVTRYDIAVDTVKIAKLLDDPDIQLQHTQLAEYGVTITAFAWVDDTGLPLKAEYRFEQDGKVVKSSTTRFTDWGTPVDVAAPPTAETVPADQLPE